MSCNAVSRYRRIRETLFDLWNRYWNTWQMYILNYSRLCIILISWMDFLIMARLARRTQRNKLELNWYVRESGTFQQGLASEDYWYPECRESHTTYQHDGVYSNSRICIQVDWVCVIKIGASSVKTSFFSSKVANESVYWEITSEGKIRCHILVSIVANI